MTRATPLTRYVTQKWHVSVNEFLQMLLHFTRIVKVKAPCVLIYEKDYFHWLIMFTIPPQYFHGGQMETFVRRHSVSVLHLAEPEESMLVVHRKRVTVDFSLLSAPCVSEAEPQASIAFQVQNTFLHRLSPLGMSHLGMLQCVP